jgi:transcriptional regulator GlxA family with amidase domain
MLCKSRLKLYKSGKFVERRIGMYVPPGGEPHAITILLLERFAMIAFSSTVEPLREANWVAGRRVFEWKVLSHNGQPVRASNGLAIQVDGSISDVSDASTVIVCSSFDPHLYTTPRIIAWLRRLDRKGAYLGAVETGAYVLARAGLLDNCRATIHWENDEGMMRQFPKVQLTGRIFEVDGRRFSAAGAAAAMDMMLHLISTCVGREIALKVAEEFIYNHMRPARVPQRLPASERMGVTKPRLKRLLSRLDAHLDERLDVSQMAAPEGVSEREVRRLFKSDLAISPKAYHRSLRLQKARSTLQQTDLPVSEVALRLGFTSSSDFCRAYRREFGRTPTQDRQKARPF